MSPYDQFHPLLAALLKKLADDDYTTRDATEERMDWVWAGCPIYTEAQLMAQHAREELVADLYMEAEHTSD